MKLNESRTETSHDDWETPEHVLKLVREVFDCPIGLDPFTTAANPTHAVCRYTGITDGYTAPWSGYVFANPPYGRGLKRFAATVEREVKSGRVEQLITLTPCRPDTVWYDQLLRNMHSICEVRGRLKFRGWSEKHGRVIDDVPAQFPCAIMHWSRAQPNYGDASRRFHELLRQLGRVRAITAAEVQ